MKDFRLIIITAIVFVFGSAINGLAQGRQQNTSSARAAYGVMPEPVTTTKKNKTKKKHKSHKTKNKLAKVAHDKSPVDRRRSAWAG